MTETLYYADAMQDTFSATIIGISDNRRCIELDKTLFYPEGGGQPGDRGTIAKIQVSDTRKNDDGSIVHYLSEAFPKRFTRGDVVVGVLNWAHRWEYMQQHTGQHLLSGALHRVLGAATVSVHQGGEVVTIEVDCSKISEEDLLAVEEDANHAIAADLPVRTFEIDHQDLSQYSLRRPTTRTGTIRLVEIEGYDLVACGGVHLPRTAMINVIKSVGVETIRGRVRIAFKIGDRALADYRLKHYAIARAAGLFSSMPDEVPDRIAALQQEVQALHRTSRVRAERIAHLMLTETKGTVKPESIVLEGEDDDVFKAIGEIASERTDRRLLLVNRKRDSLNWTIFVGSDFPFPQNALRKQVLTPVGAKGGGKPPLWRGIIPGNAGNAADTLEEFLSAFQSLWDGDRASVPYH